MTAGDYPSSAPQYPQQGGHAQPPFDPKLEPGGLGLRFLARLIDSILVNLVAFVLSFFTVDHDSWWLATGLFSGVLMFGYFVLLEVTHGATLGKRLLGLTVHGVSGSPKPDAKQAAIRNAFTLLAVLPYIGTVLAFVAYIVIAATISGSPTKQGKHDEWAGGTQVVKS